MREEKSASRFVCSGLIGEVDTSPRTHRFQSFTSLASPPKTKVRSPGCGAKPCCVIQFRISSGMLRDRSKAKRRSPFLTAVPTCFRSARLRTRSKKITLRHKIAANESARKRSHSKGSSESSRR